MTPVHSVSKDSLATAWGGVHDASAMPARREAASMSGTREAKGGSTWTRMLLRRARDVAVGLAVIVSLPLATIALRGNVLWFSTSGFTERLSTAERYRVLRAPVDATVTPQQAGLALHALTGTPSKSQSTQFPTRHVPAVGARVWNTRELTPDMFPKIRGTWFKGPAPQAVVMLATAGFNANELAYLRAVAESPLWREFDLVAHASAIDMIGGRFVLPFREDAVAAAMPILRFTDTRSLASAGVSRAAYYLAIGDQARAEAALRSIVSFGFSLADNATSTTDAMIGRLVVDIGRDGLHQFYEATHNQALADLASIAHNAPAQARLTSVRFPSADETIAQLIADARNPQLPRAIRFGQLHQLSITSCGSVRGVLQGQPDEVRQAFDDAKRNLARYPSERAYLDLLLESVERVPEVPGLAAYVPRPFTLGAASVASVVLHNPRIAACSRIVSAYR